MWLWGRGQWWGSVSEMFIFPDKRKTEKMLEVKMSICPPQSRDSDHTRKSSGKQGLDTSGNLYQYDNYDEVAMDTDSETNSPGERSAHLRMHSQHVSTFLKVLYRTHPTSWIDCMLGHGHQSMPLLWCLTVLFLSESDWLKFCSCLFPASSPVHDPFEVQGCFTHMPMPFPMDSPQYRIVRSTLNSKPCCSYKWN